MGKVHDTQLNNLLWHLEDALDLEGIVVSAKEVNFLSNRRIICQPDIVAIDKRGGLYVVEYKGGDDTERRAVSQLTRANEFIDLHYGLRPRLFYVHGNNESKEIFL